MMSVEPNPAIGAAIELEIFKMWPVPTRSIVLLEAIEPLTVSVELLPTTICPVPVTDPVRFSLLESLIVPEFTILEALTTLELFPRVDVADIVPGLMSVLADKLKSPEIVPSFTMVGAE